MKRITPYILLVLSFVFVVSCQKDDSRGRVSFGLRVADKYDGGNSKVYMEGSTPVFIEDEEVLINGETYLIDHRSGSAAVYDVAESDQYYAIYPASWVSGSASAEPSISFPDMQKWREDGNGHQVVENPMVAYTTEDGSTLNFHNVAALAKVHITNHYGSAFNIKYVSLYADDISSGGAYLSGNGTITGIKTATPSVSITSGITNVSIDCSDMESLANGDEVDISLALPPISNVKLWVDVYMEDGSKNKYSFTKSTTSGKTIGRNQMGTINVELSNSGADAVNACGLFWGTGVSVDDPFIIMDVDDLKHLKANVSSSTYNASTVYYLQTANIDLSEESDWLGIGTSAKPFVAHYDGSEAWVKMNINDLESVPAAGDGVGLFAFVGGGGEIKNLTTKGRIAPQGRNVHVGGIVGKVVGAFTIDNCKNEIPLNTYGSSSYTNPYGGICGHIDATGATVTIKNCTNNAAISRNTYGTIGGICGSIQIGTVSFESNTNNGNLSGTGAGSQYTGGILGQAKVSTVTFEDCVNNGNLTSASQGTGGIVGYCDYEVHITGTKTKNTGTIQGTNDVGGIVGRASKAMINQTSGKTINEGAIISTSGSSYSYGVGGIIGNVNTNDTYNTIKNCWNKGSVTTSGLDAGGIVGRVTQCKIDCCKNTGTVTVGNTSGAYSAAGGIVGITYGAGTTINISNCGVEDCDLSTSDKKSNYCGGIVGYARDNVNITNCYAIVGNMYGSTSACGIMGYLTYTSAVRVTSVNCYSQFYAQSGTNKKPTVHTGSNGNLTTTDVYCNSNYAASPSSTTGSAGYPTAYFSTSDGSATTGSFYNDNTTLGDALRDYRNNVLGSTNYISWTTGATPKLDWVGTGIFSSTD